MSAIDWTNIYKKYRGFWVAVKSMNRPTIVAYGTSLQEVMEKSQRKGIDQPLVTQIPRKVLPIVGTN